MYSCLTNRLLSLPEINRTECTGRFFPNLPLTPKCLVASLCGSTNQTISSRRRINGLCARQNFFAELAKSDFRSGKISLRRILRIRSESQGHMIPNNYKFDRSSSFAARRMNLVSVAKIDLRSTQSGLDASQMPRCESLWLFKPNDFQS